MTTKKIYSPLIKWHGGECPVPPSTLVEVRFRSWSLERGRADDYRWHHDGVSADIVEYRTVTEQAALDAAAQLLLANGYTITPSAKPLTFEDVTPLTEVPPEGTRYWVISATECDGVYSINSYGSVLDHQSIKRRMAYLDKEHALIAARHIFGLKGGEL